MTSHPDLEHDLRALQALQGAPWVPEDYVLFRREVREAQGSVEAQLAEGTPGVDPSDERPLPTALPLGKDDVPWDEWMLADLLDEIVEITARRAPDNPDLARVRDALNARRGQYTQFAAQAVYSPENDTFRKLARDLETPLFGLLMLGRLLAAPFFRTARRRAEGLVRREEFSGRCPVCHQPATQSKLRLDDGRRVLGCSLCDEEWLFPRITCPFCGTKEQSHFQVVYLDDDDLRWIATCDACHRYVKCIDQRKLGDGTPFSFFAEETASLSLDLLAEREGYVRPF